MGILSQNWRPYKTKDKDVLFAKKKHIRLEDGMVAHTDFRATLDDIKGPEAQLPLNIRVSKDHKTAKAYRAIFNRDEFTWEAYEQFLSEFIRNPEFRVQFEVDKSRKRKKGGNDNV